MSSLYHGKRENGFGGTKDLCHTLFFPKNINEKKYTFKFLKNRGKYMCKTYELFNLQIMFGGIMNLRIWSQTGLNCKLHRAQRRSG